MVRNYAKLKNSHAVWSLRSEGTGAGFSAWSVPLATCLGRAPKNPGELLAAAAVTPRPFTGPLLTQAPADTPYIIVIDLHLMWLTA